MLNSVQDRSKTRNITPRKPADDKSDKAQLGQPHPTERCSSKASRASLEAYQRRILQLSQLKKKSTSKEGTTRLTHFQEDKRLTSNQKPHLHPEKITIHRLGSDRRKNTSSNKNILPRGQRTPSNQRRIDQSLKKEQERAEKHNVQFLQNVVRNSNPAQYFSKLKAKKVQTKKTSKGKLLNLKTTIGGPQQMQKFEIYSELGQGAYGVVKMGVDKRTGQKIAVKIYEKRKIDEPNKVRNLERQINILCEVSHPIIAKLVQVIETQQQIYIMMEYGGANSLYNYLLSKPDHRLQQTEAKRFLLIIADALHYLHQLNIVHRDIKAQNILINRHKQLKLIDFGFSLRCGPKQTIDTFCGTPTYMAPQIVSKQDHVPIYTDMWSLGVLFFVMLQGNYPFRAKTENQLFEKIRKGQFEYIHSDVSQESRKMIQNLLKVNPLQRLTIQQVLSKPNREWLSTNVQ